MAWFCCYIPAIAFIQIHFSDAYYSLIKYSDKLKKKDFQRQDIKRGRWENILTGM